MSPETSGHTGKIETMGDPQYESYVGLDPKRITHWEHWSDPDAATYITGINFYKHPISCMLRTNKIYPFLRISVPESDDPVPKLNAQKNQGKGRRGHEYRDHWQQEVASNMFETQPESIAIDLNGLKIETGSHALDIPQYSPGKILAV